ncbi:hypothetical protein [Amycolatopsis viridis]|uniref:Uncharacterized protein n=1 Tax=Amycolatopsis viridis TaxID=185678 RepID=A0ABX0SVE4_9PSEU|nr:hypothetical protein [Amycolatopsis viridis]NIH80944.1 hypothetical protein [Amycolatopsis viridis]
MTEISADKREGHPPTAYMREDPIMAEVREAPRSASSVLSESTTWTAPGP